MTTRSIFQKVCPSCMATLANDAVECACGFSFEQGDDQPSSVEIRIKAEELYESYLAARAEQAVEAVKTAQADFSRDPGSPAKSKNIARFVNEARTAEANLAAQRAHIAELRKLVKAAPVAPAPVASPAPVATKPVAVKPVVQQVVRRTAAQAAPAPKPEKPRPERTARARVVVRTPKTDVHATVPVKQATISIPVPVVAAAAPTPAPVIPKPSAPSAVPDKAFREVQAAKAARVMRTATKPEVKPKPLPPAEQVVEAVAAPAPVAAPAKPAPTRKPMLLRSTGKECPNCTATVSDETSRCRCGYEFAPGGSLIPGLAMTEEERAAFARIFT